ncbi:MAG: ATP-dependent zinc metalloprotease FtsH [Gemmatimonadota bacterium]|nr:ATP-dependent zinc metalloprotease FtsH [Gemmatimonadota bacterium]
MSQPPSQTPQNDRDGQNQKQTAPRRPRTLAIWLLLILVAMFASNFLARGTDETVNITYSEFHNHLQTDNIDRVTISEKQITGRLKGAVSIVVDGRSMEYVDFILYIPFEDSGLVGELLAHDVIVDAQPESASWVGYLLSALPWLLLIAFWIFILRQMQNGQRGMFSFGKSRHKLITGDRPTVTFEDVAGVPEAKRDLEEIVEFLKTPDKFHSLGGRIPKGALLLGPPGTGKTLLARAVAGEAGVPFFSMSGSDFVEMFVGVGASRVRDLFEQARQNSPCIIFIDEIDAIGRHRGAGLGGGHDEREQTLNQLLVGLDGFEPTDAIIVIGATNRPDVLDPALLRPGRFDRHIIVDQPDVVGREKILGIHIRNQKIPVDDAVKLDELSKGVPGMSGADLANLVNEAALLAARKNHEKVSHLDFDEAKDKLVMGAKRHLVISDEEREIVAYHEAGHALLMEHIEEFDLLLKVSILPQGRGLGVTIPLPEERRLMSKQYCLASMAVALGGRVAEKLIYDEFTSGASNDIEKVTGIGRHMVCEWGMSDKLGATALGEKEGEVFLGKDIARRPNYGQDTAELIDKEIRKFVKMAEERATTILTKHMDQLHIVAKALLEKDTLTREEVHDLICPDDKKTGHREEIAEEVAAQDPDKEVSPKIDVAEMAEGQTSKTVKI